MRKVSLFFSIILLFGTIHFAFGENAPKRDWSDLDEGERQIFGSEKEAKYPINAFFIEKEKWENHYSLMFFWLFRYTDYPKYQSLRIFPFWYQKESKIDNRQRTFVPILFLYNRIDGYSNLTVSPFYFSNLGNNEAHRSLFYLFWWGNTEWPDYHKNYIFSPIFYKSYYESRKYGTEESIWINPIFYYHSDTFKSKALPSEKGQGGQEIEKSATSRTWWFPLIPITYHYTSPKGGHRNFFWLMDYEWSTDIQGDHLNRFWFFPFVMHKPGSAGYDLVLPPLYVNLRYSNGENWHHAFPFFLFERSGGYEYDYRANSTFDTYTDLKVFPLVYLKNVYKGPRKWDEDKPFRSTTWFPLYYSHYQEGSGTHRNVALLFDWQTGATGSIERLWLIPFYFNKKGEYRHVFPPLWLSWQGKSQSTIGYGTEYSLRYRDESSIFTPLWYYSYDSSYSVEKIIKSPDPRESEAILTAKDEKSKEREDPAGAKRYLIENTAHYTPFFYYHSKTSQDTPLAQKNISKKLWIPLVPLLFSRSVSTLEGSHYNVLLLWDWQKDIEKRFTRFWLLPLYCYTADYFPEKGGFNKFHYSPFFYINVSESRQEKDQKLERESRFWFPIIPLVYSAHYARDGSKDRNILTLFNWKRDAQERLTELWFLPLHYYKADYFPHGYKKSHYSPFFYASELQTDTPLGTSAQVELDAPPTVTTKQPPDLSANENKGVQESRFWLPILPLIYSSYKSSLKGTDRNLLMLFNWEKNVQGDWKSFWFTPLIFHSFEKSGYRFYPPIYFRPGGWTDEEGFSFGLFPKHFHTWSKGENMEWSFFVHYERQKPAAKEDINVWAPVWFNWQYSDWRLKIFLPFYFDYEDSKKYLHVNLLFTTSRALGTNPKVDFALGRNERGFYFDTDVSVLINLLSWKTRLTIPWKKSDKTEPNIHLSTKDLKIFRLEDTKIIIKKEPQKPGERKDALDSIEGKKKSLFKKESGLSKENSIYYWEWSFLFGLVSYKEADNWTHFRILPLWWISKDKNSDDKMRWIFIYLDYQSDNESYHIFFPFFARQRLGNSYWQNYLLIAFMNEWDESLKNRELTFIWPLINWYNSPEKSGIRFLPLFWFRNYLESASDLSVNYEVPIGPPMPELLNPDKVMVKTKIILPLLYYSHERSRPRDNHTISDFSISPFHYYNYQEENGRPAKSLWIPLIPLIYYTSGIVPGASGQMEEHKLLVAAGLYVYRYKPDEIYKSYLFWLYQKYEYPREEMSETWLLYGLYKKISFKGKNESRFLPFYYYLNEPPKWQFSLLMGMFKYTTEKSVLANDLYPDTSLKILYGMFYTGAEFHRKSIFLDKQSASIDIKTRRVFILPLLLYYSGDTGLDNSVTHTDYMQIWPFWYRDYDETGTNKTAAEKDPATKALEVKSEPKTYHATLWFPILPVFYRYADNERTHVNLLGLFDWEKNYRTEAMRLWVLPLFYLNSFKEKTESRFLPLYYYLNEPKKWELSLLLGLFSHASENSHRVRTPHQDSSWKVLYGIFYTSAEYRQKYIYLENRGANIEIKNRFFMFLPLLYFYSADESIDQNINYQDKMQIWPLYYKSYDEKETKNGSGTLSGTRVYHSSFWFPIVPLIYYYTENERTHLNLFWFVDWERNYRLDTKRLWIFPFFYNKTSPQESTQFIMGLYLTREKFYNRQNIMYLYDQKEYDQPGQPYANFRQTSMLLGMVDYKTSETIKRFRLFYGLLMDYKNYPQSERYKFDMLWFIYNNENTGYQFKHSFFLTFYYTSYNNNPDKWSLFSPLGLSYINHSEYEKFDFIGMGLLWYRNDKLKANYERQMLLLGIPYFYVKKPERGYESRGSLWGLLWEYETEKETNFAKLSILKFIYKRVDMNGNVYHKILGITF